VANLAQCPDVVEASIGDLVDVVLHGQLAVQVVTEVPDDNVALDYMFVSVKCMHLACC